MISSFCWYRRICCSISYVQESRTARTLNKFFISVRGELYPRETFTSHLIAPRCKSAVVLPVALKISAILANAVAAWWADVRTGGVIISMRGMDERLWSRRNFPNGGGEADMFIGRSWGSFVVLAVSCSIWIRVIGSRKFCCNWFVVSSALVIATLPLTARGSTIRQKKAWGSTVLLSYLVSKR